MAIASNWYWFLVFAIILVALILFTLFIESKKRHDDILLLKPRYVLLKILLNLISFYVVYIITMFSLDITKQERFYYTQVFTSLEVSFLTPRGYLTFIGLVLSYITTVITQIAIVQVPTEMIDHSVTLGVLHFIVTSIVQGDFPVNYAWWIGVGAGVLALILLSEYISYKLQTMAYKSNLGGAGDKRSSSKTTVPATEVLHPIETKFTSVSNEEDDDFDYIPRRLRASEIKSPETAVPKEPQANPPSDEDRKNNVNIEMDEKQIGKMKDDAAGVSTV